MNTYTATITQYHRPNGHTTEGYMDLPVQSEDAYKEMVSKGYFLTVELIPPNLVNVCIDTGEEDVATILTPADDKDLPQRISNMLAIWYRKLRTH